jgi:hypothetical protein
MQIKIKKDWYGRLKSVEELHNDSRLWISEIDFILDEIRFLKKLLSSNYIQLLDAGLNKKVTRLIKEISEKNITATMFTKLIKDHNNKLSNLIKSKSVTSNIHYLDTHKKLEVEIKIFSKRYKKIKRQIFEILDEVMSAKGVKKLL